jgi:hypothetical protein
MNSSNNNQYYYLNISYVNNSSGAHSLLEITNFSIIEPTEIYSLEYFNLKDTNYIILSFSNHSSASTLFLHDLDNNTRINIDNVNGSTSNTIKHFKYIDNILYYSEDQSIYKVDAFTPHQSNINVKHINSTEVYKITDQNITINNFDLYGNTVSKYMYVATNNGVYSNNLDSTVLNTTEENILDNVILYPNPNTGSFTVSNLDKNTQLQILDINGKVILEDYSYNSNEVIHCDIKNGVYFVHIKQEDSLKVLKFIKQ